MTQIIVHFHKVTKTKFRFSNSAPRKFLRSADRKSTAELRASNISSLNIDRFWKNVERDVSQAVFTPARILDNWDLKLKQNRFVVSIFLNIFRNLLSFVFSQRMW